MNAMDNIWIANMVTSVGVGGLLWYGFKRYVTQQDDRHKLLDSKVDDCDDRSDKIEKNYIKKFDEVRKEINDSNKELGSEITKEIREITKDKNAADLALVKELAEMKGDMKHLQDSFNQIKRVLK